MLSRRNRSTFVKRTSHTAFVVGGLACLLAPLSVQAQGLNTFYYNQAPANIAANTQDPAYNSLSTLQSQIFDYGLPDANQLTPILNVGDHGQINGAGTDYQGAAFPANVGPNNFQGYLSGMINISSSGAYTFGTSSDDGTVLFVDGQMVVNNNTYQGFNFNGAYPITAPGVTGTINLNAGYHNIVLGYYQGGGAYSFDALVSGPDTYNTFVDLGDTANSSPPLTPDTGYPSITGSAPIDTTTGNLIVGYDNTSTTFGGKIFQQRVRSVGDRRHREGRHREV